MAGQASHVAKPLSVILQLKPKKLARPANVPASRDSCVSPPIVKESTVTPAFASLELSSNTLPTSSAAVLKPNKEWANAMVDGSDHEMTDRAADANLGNVFVQGASHDVDDDVVLTLIGSECVPSGLNDVVVSLSAGEKGPFSVWGGVWYAREHFLLRVKEKLTVDNEQWINAMVNVPSNEMAEGVANDKPEDVFVQGVSHTVSDVSELSLGRSEHVSSGPNDVVVALSIIEKIMVPPSFQVLLNRLLLPPLRVTRLRKEAHYWSSPGTLPKFSCFTLPFHILFMFVGNHLSLMFLKDCFQGPCCVDQRKSLTVVGIKSLHEVTVVKVHVNAAKQNLVLL
nr:hypothetical protein [Tanacetum cinerariifolium]